MKWQVRKHVYQTINNLFNWYYKIWGDILVLEDKEDKTSDDDRRGLEDMI
jgi:hypothetical protein